MQRRDIKPYPTYRLQEVADVVEAKISAAETDQIAASNENREDAMALFSREITTLEGLAAFIRHLIEQVES